MNVVVFQWPWGNGRHHPFAARCPAITPGHVRPRPGLVEKDQPFGNQPRLLVAPSGSRRRDVRALLLGGVGCLFFATQPLSQKKVAKRSSASASIPSAASKTAKLVNGDVAILHHQSPNAIAMGSQFRFLPATVFIGFDRAPLLSNAASASQQS